MRTPLVLLSSLAVVLSACGRPAPPPADPVARTRREGTARVALTIVADQPGARPLRLAGSMALDGRRSVVTFDLADLGIPTDGDGRAELRVIDDAVYLRPPRALVELPAGASWIKVKTTENLGVLAYVAENPPSIDPTGEIDLDSKGRIQRVRSVRHRPPAPDLLTIVELFDFGVPLTIEPPPEDQVAHT